MYEKHFALKENPFPDSQDPRFYFNSEEHEQSFLRLLYAIEQKKALAAMYGAPGTGKTMLCQRLISALPSSRYQRALILCTANMGPTMLLSRLLSEVEGGGNNPARSRPSLHGLLKALEGHAVAAWRRGKRLVVFVDEVHYLPSPSLHLLKTVSNLETPKEKLVTCLLIGEPRFQKRLNGHSVYSSLSQRITLTAHLEPLEEEEVKPYVEHRLAVAGASKPVFAPETFPLLFEVTHGLCRQINKIAEAGLIEAFWEKSPTVQAKHIERAAELTTR